MNRTKIMHILCNAKLNKLILKCKTWGACMILRQLRRLFSHTKASRALQDTSGRPMTMEITDSAVQVYLENHECLFSYFGSD